MGLKWHHKSIKSWQSLVPICKTFCLVSTKPLPSSLWYKTHFSRQLNCWPLRCSWSIACRRCANYIFILDLTPGFNGLGEDNYKMIRETFKFWDLVRLILETLRYLKLWLIGHVAWLSLLGILSWYWVPRHIVKFLQLSMPYWTYSIFVIILGMGSAGERWRYNVMLPLIGWAHTQNNPSILFHCLRKGVKLKSLRPSDAYMSINLPSLIQMMAWCLVRAKQLSKPMLEYCELDPWEQTSVKS